MKERERGREREKGLEADGGGDVWEGNKESNFLSCSSERSENMRRDEHQREDSGPSIRERDTLDRPEGGGERTQLLHMKQRLLYNQRSRPLVVRRENAALTHEA